MPGFLVSAVWLSVLGIQTHKVRYLGNEIWASYYDGEKNVWTALPRVFDMAMPELTPAQNDGLRQPRCLEHAYQRLNRIEARSVRACLI